MTTPMIGATMKTGSWWTPLPANHVRIGISRGVPRGLARYRVFRKLQPGPWFNSVDVDEYRRLYKAEVLDRLDPLGVAADLEELAGGGVPVLCCYERAGSGSWCHRALVAGWLSEALRERVPELGL
jgi:hypothetical protein